MWLGWLITIIILTIIELATEGLVTIWFITSGIIALIVSLFINSFYIQFLVFGSLGIILIITTRSFLEKKLKSKKNKNDLNKLIGMQGVVTKTIKKDTIGEVKVDGKLWSAVSTKRILKNQTVIVEDVTDEKLVVKK